MVDWSVVILVDWWFVILVDWWVVILVDWRVHNEMIRQKFTNRLPE